MSLLARYLLQLALVTALFLAVWTASAHAGMSDGGLGAHPDGWSWND